MVRPLATRAEVLDRLMDSFRTHGYDGASLATLSRRTGLGKSSLYHHFPEGKEQMAVEVLRHLNEGFDQIYQAVESEPDPGAKRDLLLNAIDDFYAGGEMACLLERLTASVDRDRFMAPLRTTFRAWMSAVEGICLAAGMTDGVARRRAEDVVVRIEGALVVSAGTGDTTVFKRTLQEIRDTLLSPYSARQA